MGANSHSAKQRMRKLYQAVGFLRAAKGVLARAELNVERAWKAVNRAEWAESRRKRK